MVTAKSTDFFINTKKMFLPKGASEYIEILTFGI